MSKPVDDLKAVERVERICTLAEYENKSARVPTDDLRTLLRLAKEGLAK